MADLVNFEIREGKHKDLVLTIRDSAGNAKNVTGATVTFKLKRTRESAVDVVSLSSDTAAIEVAVPANENVTIHFTPTETTGLVGSYVYEVAAVDAASKEATTNYGVITVLHSLT